MAVDKFLTLAHDYSAMKDRTNKTREVEPQELFVSLLRRLRLERGLTQAALAGLLEVDPSTVSWWESGKYLPSPQFVPKLARVLRVKPRVITNALMPMDDAAPVAA
jgi:DNA-binding XRE family transcriptional regulator